MTQLSTTASISVTEISTNVEPNAVKSSEIAQVLATYGIDSKLLYEYTAVDELYKETKKRREAITTAIKEAFEELNLDHVELNGYTIDLATTHPNRFDSAKFKKENGDLYAKYTVKSKKQTLTIEKQ